MKDLQELISAMRTARAENAVDPRKPVRVQVRCSPDVQPFLELQLHHLRNLVVTKTIDFVSELDVEELHVEGSARLAGFSLLLDDIIDVDAERRRLRREMERSLKEIAGAEKRLADRRFLEKAPEDIVEGVRRRRAEISQRIGQIEASLAKLPTKKEME